MSNTKTNLEQYYQTLKTLRAFGHAQSVMSWDRETHMPKGGIVERGEAMAVLSGFSHQIATDPQFIKIVNGLYEKKDQLNDIDRRSVTVAKRDLDKSVKLPKEFVEETNEIVNASHGAWAEAKQTNNFLLFAPHLEKVIENRKQYAAYINPDQDPYDVSLDDYEEGLTSSRLDVLFPQLKRGIMELLPKVLEKQQQYPAVPNPLDNIELDYAKVEAFLKEMIMTIGFDVQRGGVGWVEHPFEISLSVNDVRLNTHREELNHSFTFTGMIHELGHGLYEQNCDPTYVAAHLDHGVSLGIHESQSRFLENYIGRSSAFWNYFFPKLQAYFHQLKSARTEDLVAALNRVQPSFIRTESDEVTYNLHIILRYELEKGILRGETKVSDLPELWRSTMKEIVGVTPPTDREGVLQDVHWSWGNFGYFPTYSLGNLNAAQLGVKFAEAHPNWEQEVEQGDFSSYFSWFKENVWKFGSFLTPDEVMKKATGESTDAKYFISYLKKKYLE